MSKSEPRQLSHARSVCGLAMTLLLAGAVGVWAATPAAGSPLARRIFDRLSLLYLMDGEMEKSIALQKEAMDRSDTAQAHLVVHRGRELVRLLEAKGELTEASRWQTEIEGFGADHDLSTAPPVLSRLPAAPAVAVAVKREPGPVSRQPLPPTETPATSPAAKPAARAPTTPAAAPAASKPEPATATARKPEPTSTRPPAAPVTAPEARSAIPAPAPDKATAAARPVPAPAARPAAPAPTGTTAPAEAGPKSPTVAAAAAATDQGPKPTPATAKTAPAPAATPAATAAPTDDQVAAQAPAHQPLRDREIFRRSESYAKGIRALRRRLAQEDPAALEGPPEAISGPLAGTGPTSEPAPKAEPTPASPATADPDKAPDRAPATTLTTAAATPAAKPAHAPEPPVAAHPEPAPQSAPTPAKAATTLPKVAAEPPAKSAVAAQPTPTAIPVPARPVPQGRPMVAIIPGTGREVAVTAGQAPAAPFAAAEPAPVQPTPPAPFTTAKPPTTVAAPRIARVWSAPTHSPPTAPLAPASPPTTTAAPRINRVWSPPVAGPALEQAAVTEAVTGSAEVAPEAAPSPLARTVERRIVRTAPPPAPTPAAPAQTIEDLPQPGDVPVSGPVVKTVRRRIIRNPAIAEPIIEEETVIEQAPTPIPAPAVSATPAPAHVARPTAASRIARTTSRPETVLDREPPALPRRPAAQPPAAPALVRSTELVRRVVEPAPANAQPGEKVYRLNAKPLLPADLPRIPIRSEEEPRQTVVSESKTTSELHALSDIKVTLNFKDVEIATIVNVLAEKASLNIVSRNPITGRTTVNFQDITVGTALDTILRNNDYAYDLRDGIVWIYRRGEEPPETRVFFVRHVPAADLVEIARQSLASLDGMAGAPPAQTAPMGAFPRTPVARPVDTEIVAEPAAAAAGRGPEAGSSPGGMPAGSGSGLPGSAGMSGTGMPFSGQAGGHGAAARVQRWRLQVDERSNSLIITAPRTTLEEIGRLLQVFDVPMDSRRMEERIFKVKYIDRTTLEKAIKMVLPRFDAEKQMLNINRIDLGGGTGGTGSAGGSAGTGRTGGAGQ